MGLKLSGIRDQQRTVVGRRAQEVAHERHGIVAALRRAEPYGHQDRLRRRAGLGSVAAPDLAVDDRRPDRLLGTPVGRVEATMAQEGEQLVAVRPEMSGEAFVGRVALDRPQQRRHPLLQFVGPGVRCGHREPPGIAQVAGLERFLQ